MKEIKHVYLLIAIFELAFAYVVKFNILPVPIMNILVIVQFVVGVILMVISISDYVHRN